jgi:hypothetical protein|tara:strand:- start:24 stop:200 length:177 start_codon:yes stop_codon:yes gene_type:complete
MENSNEFLKQAKLVQDQYVTGTLLGQKFLLESLIQDFKIKLKDVEERLSKYPPYNLTK